MAVVSATFQPIGMSCLLLRKSLHVTGDFGDGQVTVLQRFVFDNIIRFYVYLMIINIVAAFN